MLGLLLLVLHYSTVLFHGDLGKQCWAVKTVILTVLLCVCMIDMLLLAIKKIGQGWRLGMGTTVSVTSPFEIYSCSVRKWPFDFCICITMIMRQSKNVWHAEL